VTENPATKAPDGVPQDRRDHDEWVRAEVQALEAGRAREAAADAKKLKASIGIPVKFLALVEGTGMRQTDAMAEVKRDDFAILVLAGDVGRGKTVAASWWALQGLREKRTPLFVSSARLSRWDRYNDAEMQRLLLASRLVIDDLGEEFNDTKGNFLAVLDETISDRLANERRTVITTNLTVEVFTERYGVRIRDRIKESGRWQNFAGASMRGKQLGREAVTTP